MTNANLPDRWLSDRRFRRERLSDAGFRAFVNALMWSVGNRTEGVIEPDDLKLIPDFDRATIKELVCGDLWEPRPTGRGWLIVDFPTTQTGKDLLAKYEKEKALDRRRKAKKRAEELAAQLAAEGDSGGSSAGRIPVESPSTEQNRQNQPRREEDDHDETRFDHQWPAWRGAGPNPFDEYR